MKFEWTHLDGSIWEPVGNSLPTLSTTMAIRNVSAVRNPILYELLLEDSMKQFQLNQTEHVASMSFIYIFFKINLFILIRG